MSFLGFIVTVVMIGGLCWAAKLVWYELGHVYAKGNLTMRDRIIYAVIEIVMALVLGFGTVASFSVGLWLAKSGLSS